MKLTDKLNAEFLEARKAKDTLKINLLSTFKGQVQLEKSKAVNKDKSEEDIVEAVARSLIKSLDATGTPESQIEREIIADYLPKQLSREEVEAIIATLGFNKSDPMGDKMSKAIAACKGRANGAVIKHIILNEYS